MKRVSPFECEEDFAEILAERVRELEACVLLMEEKERQTKNRMRVLYDCNKVLYAELKRVRLMRDHALEGNTALSQALEAKLNESRYY